MKRKNLWKLLYAFLILNVSCANVKIEDGEWCGETLDGASCFRTLSDETRDVTAEEWSVMRVDMVCTNYENFGEWKKAILKLCKISRACTYDTKKKVIVFHSKVKGLFPIAKSDMDLETELLSIEDDQSQLVSCH